MLSRFITWLLSIILFSTAYIQAQHPPDKLIDADFKEAPIGQFVKQLQQETGYQFFYDNKQLDSLRITLTAKSQTLSQILEKALQEKGFFFSIAGKRVFITKGWYISTQLPDNVSGSDTNKQNNRQAVARMLSAYDEKSRKETIVPVVTDNKLYEIGNKTNQQKTGNATIAGYVKNDKTGEPLVGVSIYIDHPRIGVFTDQFGYYSISLPRGRHTLNIQSMGMKDLHRQIQLNADGKMNMEMREQIITLRNVDVAGGKSNNIKRTQMGLEKLTIKTIKQVPTVFGEADILRVVLTLPGVKSVGEAATGFNVRGGAADQNLILFNDATIYNPAHFFGFFSAFNPEVVKEVELYKSSVPTKYGGRLSSVLDVKSREGNKKNLAGSAGIGVVTSRLNLEGPLIKDKMSFIIGGRTTYANWLLQALPAEYKNSKASFYDVNLHLAYQANKSNSLYLTGYLSRDRFNLNNDTTYGYGNKNISLKWKHVFNNKLYGVFTTGYDGYDYNITSDKDPVTAYKLTFDINQLNAKLDFDYHLDTKHTFSFGLSTIRYKLHPGNYQALGDKSITRPDQIPAEQGQESAVYLSDHYEVSSALALDLGMRYSMFNYLGPQNINLYAPGIPKEEVNQLETVSWNKGKVIKTYTTPEYRLSARYAFSNKVSVKAAYNTLSQYIHTLSNTTAMAPTDIFKLSDPNIKPQSGSQVSLGLYSNFKSNTVEASIEVYYKRISDYLDYKSGAQLILNHHIETDVLSTKGKAYGLEFMLKKLTGKLNGWFSYTYSRTFLKMDDPAQGELVNRGEYYPANYDKPHDFTMIGNYRLSHRFSVSLNVTYSTGRPITLPVARYYYAGAQRVLYEDRNNSRIPDYFRSDFSLNIEGNHKVKQKTHNSWTFGVYNWTGQRNPYSVYFVSENGKIKGYKLSIFGTAIPYINFNIRF